MFLLCTSTTFSHEINLMSSLQNVNKDFLLKSPFNLMKKNVTSVLGYKLLWQGHLCRCFFNAQPFSNLISAQHFLKLKVTLH